MTGRRNASTKSCSNAHVGGSAEAEKAPQSVSKAKMVVNLIKKFTHSGGGGGSAATNSGNGTSSSAKKGSGRLDHELERLNSKIVSCTYLSLSLSHSPASSDPILFLSRSADCPSSDKRPQGHLSDAETNCTGLEKSDSI